MHGWRAHLGKIANAPIEAWVTREFYDVMPEGIDVTIALLEIRTRQMKAETSVCDLAEHPAKLLAERGADVVYLDAVAPVVQNGAEYDRIVIDVMQAASGRKCTTSITAATDALKLVGARRIVLASLFEPALHGRIKNYLATRGIEVVHARSYGDDETRSAGDISEHFEYSIGRRVVQEYSGPYDALYMPLEGAETLGNVARLERDFGKPVITSQSTMMWWFLKNAGVKAHITGCGSLLETTHS